MKNDNKTKGADAIASSDVLCDNFEPSLRCVSGNTWEASIEIPVVGRVTTDGIGWEQARIRLWLVACAVELLSKQSEKCKPPQDWADDEWRTVLKTMRSAMSPYRYLPQSDIDEVAKPVVAKSPNADIRHGGSATKTTDNQ